MADEGIERYVRVLHGSLGHPKFIGLTAAERGTWLVALVLADISHPGAVHEAAVLEKCPDASFERLYERELIEQNGRGQGWFHVHDLKQFHVHPSATPEAVRVRVARHRAKKAAAATTVTDVTTGNDIRDETIRDVNLPSVDSPVDSTVLTGTQSESRAAVDEHGKPTKVGTMTRIGR